MRPVLLQPVEYERAHVIRNPVRGPRGIDRLDAPWFFAREFQKPGADALVKACGLPIQPVLSCGVALPPAQAGGHGQIEEEGQIRSQATGRPGIHGAQGFQIQPARVALIGQGGIDKPVADHDRALPQRRRDYVVHMLAARGENDEGFRFCGEGFRIGLQQHGTELLGCRCAARFPREEHGMALSAKRLCQARGLCRFPAALGAFERQERAGCAVVCSCQERSCRWFNGCAIVMPCSLNSKNGWAREDVLVLL